jgi:5-carboxymethyl-2-hydroxymuconate isomerase
MPHFIIECSNDIIKQKTPDEIMQAVYEVAEATGLFAENDIKVRINPYTYLQTRKYEKGFYTYIRKYYGGKKRRAKSRPFEKNHRKT